MIPETVNPKEFSILENNPSFTYHFDIKKNRIIGNTDGQESMKQACYKILMTERYEFPIYSYGKHRYGVELKELFGRPRNWCVAEIERRVREALLADSRVESVTDFRFDLSQRESINTQFSVHTIFGKFDMNREVPI